MEVENIIEQILKIYLKREITDEDKKLLDELTAKLYDEYCSEVDYVTVLNFVIEKRNKMLGLKSRTISVKGEPQYTDEDIKRIEKTKQLLEDIYKKLVEQKEVTP